MCDEKGKLVWDVEYDIYGNIRAQLKGHKDFVPFRYQGQYEDLETGLYYNRFRYYSPDTGSYISQDPIGLEGNNPNLYGYVFDPNAQVDIFGLECDIAKTRKLAEEVSDQHKKIFQCKEFAADLKTKMKNKGIEGEHLHVQTKISNQNIWSDAAGKNISTNGTHEAIKVGDTVFDNMNPQGIDYNKWKSDLFSPSGHSINPIGF